MIGKIRHFAALGGLLACTAFEGDEAEAGSSLDDAVAEQLKDSCRVLEQRPGELVDELLDVCRGSPLGPPQSATSTGGSQAAVGTAPGIVQRRLRELVEDEEVITASVGTEGASADQAVVDLGQGLSVFASGGYGVLDKNDTRFEDGYDSDVIRFTAGGDYTIRSSLVAGLAFDYIRQDGNYQGPGNFDTSSYGVLGFAALAPTDRTYVQVVGEYLRNSSDRERLASFEEQQGKNEPPIPVVEPSKVNAHYNSNLFYLSAGGAYRQPLGKLNIIPSLGISWTRIEYESYAENGDTGLELRFDGDDQTLILSTVGLTVSSVVETRFGAVVPEAGIEWKHEFANDQRSVDVSFVDDQARRKFSYETESPDRNFGVVSGGVVAVLPNGLQPFVSFQALVANEQYDGYSGLAGVRYSF
jgi:uncharacterized protein with beta-barrel porin domain